MLPWIVLPSVFLPYTLAISVGQYDTKEAAYEREILNLFGYENKPHPNLYNMVTGTSDAAITFMYQLYSTAASKKINTWNGTDNEIELFLQNLVQYDDEQTSRGDDDEQLQVLDSEKPDSAISFVTQSLSARPNATDSGKVIYFDLQTDYDTSQSPFSELRVFYTTEENKYNSIVVKVFQIIHNHIPLFICQKQITSKQQSRWLVFNITDTVANWKRHPETNHGLLIRVNADNKIDVPLKDAGLTGVKGTPKKRPFLLTFFRSKMENELIYHGDDTASGSREKRSTNQHLVDLLQKAKNIKKRDSHPSNCAVDRMRVSFQDLKWNNWIVAPEGFEAGLCRGSCTYPLHHRTNTTDHALIQGLQNLITNGKFPPPCCAPSELSPLVVFLFDAHGNPVVKKYSNMIVDSCGCY